MTLIKGRARSNGRQLATYLLTKADNDNVRLLEIRGTCHSNDLKKSLVEMSLTSELTKSDRGLYHGLICPAYGDNQMSDEDWIRAADIFEQERGYQGQKRAIVLHEKKGKIHAHVVWERYDHEKGRMKNDSFNWYAQDRVREKIELEFGHQRTSQRNKHRPVMKEYLTAVWQQTKDADTFIKAIAKKGYVIAAGTERPYRVVDKEGVSFNLVKQLEGIKTKEVRERFKNTKLVREKEVIEQAQSKKTIEKQKTKPKQRVSWEKLQEAANDNIRPITPPPQPSKTVEKTHSMQMSFTVNEKDAQKAEEQLKEIVQKMDEKEQKKKELLEQIRKERLKKAKQFRENEQDL